MRGFVRFGLRAIQSQPVQTILALAMTAVGINYQQWITQKLVSPPWWLSDHLFQLGVIVLGVLLLAYVFFRQSEIDRKVPDRPDENGAAAIKKLLFRSKRGADMIRNGELVIQTMHEGMLTPAGVIEQRLRARLISELHDRLRQGHVMAWGVPRSSNTIRLIEKEEWDHLSLLTEDSDLYQNEGRGNLCATSKVHAIEYWQIGFSSANLYREFPLRALPRRIDYVPLSRPYQGPNEETF